MTAAYETVHHAGTVAGLVHHVLQWGSLANVAQYRVPFDISLRYLQPPGPVLDWGCGNGHFSFFLTQHGVHSVGLSFDEPPAVLVREPLFRHVRCEEPVRLPFADASFPAVVSMGVLEHVHETGGDQLASLAELARVLVTGGTLLVFHLPNRHTWIEFLVRQINPWLRHPVHQHSRLFTRADVEGLLPPDLSIVECGRYNIIPRNPANSLPSWLRDSRAFVAWLNLLDDSLTAVLPWFAQNWYFVLRKTTERTPIRPSEPTRP